MSVDAVDIAGACAVLVLVTFAPVMLLLPPLSRYFCDLLDFLATDKQTCDCVGFDCSSDFSVCQI